MKEQSPDTSVHEQIRRKDHTARNLVCCIIGALDVIDMDDDATKDIRAMVVMAKQSTDQLMTELTAIVQLCKVSMAADA